MNNVTFNVQTLQSTFTVLNRNDLHYRQDVKMGSTYGSTQENRLTAFDTLVSVCFLKHTSLDHL